MDLKNLVPSERLIEIVHPANKQPIGVRVTVMHIDDERLKGIKRKLQDERYRREQRGKIVSAEMQDENLNELTFATMLGWDWYNPTGVAGDKGFKADKMPSFDGKVPEFNKFNAFAIFEKLPWFRDQIGEAVSETEVFFQI